MRIGLLEAERLSPEVEQRYGSYGGMIAALLRKLQIQLDSSATHSQNFQFHRYTVDQQHLPQAAKDCDAYVITGSRCSVYENLPWISGLQQFVHDIANCNIPCLGICFGHQLLAHAFGGKVERSHKGWGVGVATFQVNNAAPWMQPSVQDFSLLVSHQDQVIQLPKEGKLLAGNEFCPNAMFQLGSSIAGMQAHPEFHPQYLRFILNKRRDNIGAQKAEQALQSLSAATNHLLVGQWITNFLVQNS